MLLNCTPIEFPFNIYSRPKLLVLVSLAEPSEHRGLTASTKTCIYRHENKVLVQTGGNSSRAAMIMVMFRNIP